MDEVSHLIIKVSSNEVGKANKELEKLGWTADRAGKASDGLTGVFKRMIGPLLGLVSAGAGLTKLVNTTRQFEVLKASLISATGSAENANVAFKALQNFASNTPYDLAQTTDAFIKLVNLGLTPSERALESYGNTAAAMGKSLNQMVEAVADAATGEFERLKEFGIKARTEADGITFIFRGTATKIRNDAASIEEFLTKLGENNFAGTMAERMKTLDGAISNLGDAWDVLFASIGEAGTGELIQKGIRMATEAIQELTDMIKSGQLQGYLDSIGTKFTGIADDIAYSWTALSDLVSGVFQSMGEESDTFAKGFREAFTQMPVNIRAAMRLIGASLGGIYEIGETVSRGLRETFFASFQFIGRVAVAAGEQIAAALNPFDKNKVSPTKFAEDVKSAYLELAATATSRVKDVVTAVNSANDAWGEGVTEILNERDAVIKASDDKIAASNRLREAYEKNKKAEASSKEGDSLGGFRQGGTGRVVSEQERRRFEALKGQLQLEEASISESYQKRLDLIRENTEKGSNLRMELERELNVQVSAEYEKVFQQRGQTVLALEEELRMAIASGRTADAEALTLQLENEEARIEESYERRRQAILASTELTEEQKLEAVTRLEAKYAQQTRTAELARQKAALTIAADFFGNLSQIASAFGKKGAKAAKAAAIVQTTIKTYESATSAYASLAGIPYVGPVLGAAAAGAAIAAGMANVAAIKGQEYSGAYEHGGMIPGGKWGLVGEAGPERVRGPALVASARTTADTTVNRASPGNVTLVINNLAPGIEVVKTGEREGDDGKIVDMVVRKTSTELTAGVQRGGTSFAKALEQTYGLKRGATA